MDSSSSNKSTKDSFIFSFTNKNNLQSANVVYSNIGECFVRDNVANVPVFGSNDLFLNLVTKPDVWYSYIRCYPTLDLPRSINIDDYYEIFQVVKK